MSKRRGARIAIRGTVQGVGFRPFVYGLATRLGLKGWVRNTSSGVDIEIQGSVANLAAFSEALRKEAPPLACIEAIEIQDITPDGHKDFRIIPSLAEPDTLLPVCPDIAMCADCERELRDPADRRYRYPFINCTNCGPRFTIIEDLPYDRPNTTMASFVMCDQCRDEYEDPLDRRFHAQPVACPECGPQVWLEAQGATLAQKHDAIRLARRMLAEGKVVAVKGLGGFHLACDANNPQAVGMLRQRKLRVDKPFALMMANMATIEAQCVLDSAGRELLASRERPIVILPRKKGSTIAREVAPGQDSLGVMLPYTPLHVLLLEPEPGIPQALVMTSGNLSEEPIAFENQTARMQLEELSDALLMHDRPIRTRCDDAVVRTFEADVYPLRRSRGYAPSPILLPEESVPLLAVGAELKNAFCLARGRHAFLSHHIGDLENYEALEAFEQGISHFERLFRIKPEAIAYDLHPDILATQYARQRAAKDGLPAIGVQHHHAHIAACMAEHGLDASAQVIGVAFDGTGYGEDGVIWGGEVLLAGYRQYQRLAHLSPVAMPGGEMAIRNPWRMAIAWLDQAGLGAEPDLPPLRAASQPAITAAKRQMELGLNAPTTTSMGRLFDAVAALAGIRQAVNYEAQAAIEMEAMVDPQECGRYAFGFQDGLIDASPVIASVVQDVRRGEEIGRIAARFHTAVARMVVQVCTRIRDHYGENRVALSGGVWQNMVLLRRTKDGLREAGFEVLLHRKVPANDGGIALGQAAVALHRLDAR